MSSHEQLPLLWMLDPQYHGPCRGHSHTSGSRTTVYPNRADFIAAGIRTSTSTTDASCCICFEKYPLLSMEFDPEMSGGEPSFPSSFASESTSFLPSLPSGSQHIPRFWPLSTEIIRCGHHFDKKCLLQWVESKNTCPMCRIELFVAHPPRETTRLRGAGAPHVRMMFAPTSNLNANPANPNPWSLPRGPMAVSRMADGRLYFAEPPSLTVAPPRAIPYRSSGNGAARIPQFSSGLPNPSRYVVGPTHNRAPVSTERRLPTMHRGSSATTFNVALMSNSMGSSVPTSSGISRSGASSVTEGEDWNGQGGATQGGYVSNYVGSP